MNLLKWGSCVASALVLLGCSIPTGQPRSSGPLVLESYERVTVVSRLPIAGQFPAIGAPLLENRDLSRTATITGVRIGGADGVFIHSSYVVPYSGEDSAYGFIRTPPKLDAESSAAGVVDSRLELWEQRVDLVGYVVDPGATVNPVILLDVEDPCGGTLSWVEIEYQMGSRTYRAVSTLNMMVMAMVGDGEYGLVPDGCVEDYPGTPPEGFEMERRGG